MNFKKITIIFFIVIFSFISIRDVFADDSDEVIKTLHQRIEEKGEELKELGEQRIEFEKKLKETGEKKFTLQSEISSINWRIHQLEISMNSNQLTIEKLELEQQSLNNDIKKIEGNINNKKKTVVQLFIELQQMDNENFLSIFLKHNTLSDSISEIQSIMTLGDNLTKNVKDLRNLQDELVKKSNKVEGTKSGIKIEQKTIENRQYLVQDQKENKKYLLNKTKDEELVLQAKVDEFEKQQMEISQMITTIEERLRLEFDSSLLPVKRPGFLSFPVTDSCITQYYGETEFAKQAYANQFHTGFDFRASIGDPVFAVADGIVAAVDNNDRGSLHWQKYQYGKYIMIKHNNNLSTLYAHLSKQIVSKNQEVKKGDIIGYSGNTGYSTAEHLHFGVYVTPITGWQELYPDDEARKRGGLIKIGDAAGLVPVGIHIDPMDYLTSMSSCY